MISESQGISNFRTYLKSAAYDYWITIGVTAVCLAIVITVPDGSPLMVLRHFTGSLLALVLPGFSLVAALWPKKTGSPAKKAELDWVLRAAFSVVLSLVMTSVVVGTLDFSPLGVGLSSVSFSLSLFTFSFATLAVFRSYKNQRFI